MSAPVVDNAAVTATVTARSMTVHCFHGYRLSTGAHQGYVSATIYCHGDNTWDPVSPCTRMFTPVCRFVKYFRAVQLSYTHTHTHIRLTALRPELYLGEPVPER